MHRSVPSAQRRRYATGNARACRFMPHPVPYRSGVAIVVFLLWHACATAQVFVGESPSGGAVVLSNFRTSETPTLLLSSPVEAPPQQPQPSSADARPVTPASSRFDRWRALIDGVAAAVDISPRLVHAVIAAESNYDPSAVSPKGAIGLMQLMPATAQRFGVQDPFVVRDNIYAGASYLKWLMNYFHGDLELVLAAYNAGEQAVVRAGHKVPRYAETQAYVRRIMADLRASGSNPL